MYVKIDDHDNAILGPAFIWRDLQHVSVLVYDAEIIREWASENMEKRVQQ